MTNVDALRAKIDAVWREIGLLSWKIREEHNESVLTELHQRSLELQRELKRDSNALGMALRQVEAGRLDKLQSPQASATDELWGAETVKDELMGSGTTGLDVRVDLRMRNVPTSMVHLLARDHVPLVSVAVKNSSKKVRRVKTTIYVEKFSAHAVETKEIATSKTHVFNLFPTFLPHRIRDLSELTMAALQIHVEDLDEKTESHNSYAIPLLARTTAILNTLDPTTGRTLDWTKYIAAWVTPSAPAVLEFLRKAADFTKLKAMRGYQVDVDGVRDHVRAIFDALKAAEIVYVHSPVSFGNHEGQFIQRIRLPRESLACRSANCIDGTVLMASLLEATAIDTGIVLVPGHAYLAFRPKRGKRVRWEFVETTMIGTNTFEEACKEAKLGTSNLRAAIKSSSGSIYVKVLSLPELRAQGIMPME